MNYYKRHVKDYIAKTAHLSLLEHGVYTRLLDIYYEREQPLSRAEAVRFLRVSSDAEFAALDAVLADFFSLDNDAYVQSRVEQEFKEAAQVAAANKENGKKGGRPRKAKTNRNETDSVISAIREESENKGNPLIHESTNPPTEKKEPAQPSAAPPPKKGGKFPAPDCPTDVDPEIWQDWISLRRAKAAPVTPTVVRKARGEAEKAGMPFADFLAVWCARGSQGLEAEWLKPHERAGPRAGPSQPLGKTAQAINALEDMKRGLAQNRTADGFPEIALLGAGPDPRR